MAYCIKEEVWANLGRGTGAKAKAAEGNDEGGSSPIDKPAAQFGSIIHLAELSRKGRGGGGSAGFIWRGGSRRGYAIRCRCRR